MDLPPATGSIATTPRPRARPSTGAALGRALASSLAALALGSGPLTACGGRTEPQSGRTGAGLSPDELASLRTEARSALRSELREEVRAELRSELRPSVLAELEREHLPAATPRAPGPDASNGGLDPQPSDPNPDAFPTEPGPNPRTEADLWNHPGTHIWPLGGAPKLVELYVGTDLDDKLPTDIKQVYPTVPEIFYCYTVFENTDPNATVTHVWRRGNRLVSRVELEVGKSPKWRTWSKQRTQPHWTGLWSCEVLGPDGTQLGLTVFQVGG